MKDKKINSKELQDFLLDFKVESSTEILEEGAKKEEIIKIAKARGINLKKNRDLAGFKNVYAFANKANKNKARLPKKKLLKALPTIVGKPVDIDHERENVVGHYIDYRYIQKDDSVVAYGVFYKSNFGDEWETTKELFKKKKLATSYEIWCPPEKRKELDDGTYELQEMEIAGGAILFKTEPAFEDAKVLEMAKKNIQKEDLVFASSYKDDEILTADYFLEEVKKNVEKRQKEENKPKETKSDTKEEKSDKKEPKVEKPKEEVKKEEPKEENKEVPSNIEKVKCQNCGAEFDSRVEDTNVKCPKCFAIVDKTGKVVYPPQIIDFNLSCPSCSTNKWILLSSKDKSSKIKCESCAKEYEISFKTNEEDLKGDKEELKEKIAFVYSTNARCYQCGNLIPVSGTSLIDTYQLTCPRCGLKFKFNRKENEKKRTIDNVKEITPEKVNKSSKDGGEDMVIPEKITEKKEPEKAEKKERLTKGSMVYDILKERGELSEEDEKNAIEPDPNAKSLVDTIKEENEAREEAKKEEPTKEKYYKTKSLRKAAKKIKELEEQQELTKSSLEKQNEKYIKGIRKTASLVISLKEEMKKIKEEVKFYKSNAVKIAKRQEELGDEFSKDLSDKDILDDDKFETAKLKKENALLKANTNDSEDIVGSKTNEQDSDWYADKRKKINDYAYGKEKRTK